MLHPSGTPRPEVHNWLCRECGSSGMIDGESGRTLAQLTQQVYNAQAAVAPWCPQREFLSQFEMAKYSE